MAETAEQTQDPSPVRTGGDRAHQVATLVMLVVLAVVIALFAYGIAEYGVSH